MRNRIRSIGHVLNLRRVLSEGSACVGIDFLNVFDRIPVMQTRLWMTVLVASFGGMIFGGPVRAGTPTGPTLVTVHLTNVPPKAVIEQLATQSGGKIAIWPDHLWDQGIWSNVTITCDNRPFWEAMLDLCRQSGMSVKSNNMEPRMTVLRGLPDGMSGRHFISGPFLVVAKSIRHNQYSTLTLSDGLVTNTGSTVLNVSIFSEPAVIALGHVYDAVVDEAIDEKGLSIIMPKEQRRDPPLGWAGQSSWGLSVQLAPKAGSTNIVRLTGHTQARVQTESERVEFPDIATATNLEKSVAGRRIVIERMVTEDKCYTVHLSIYGKQDGLNTWFPDSYNTQLLDAGGRAFGHVGHSANGKDDKWIMEIKFEAPVVGNQPTQQGPPAALILDMPTRSSDVTIPFEFTNIPLP